LLLPFPTTLFKKMLASLYALENTSLNYAILKGIEKCCTRLNFHSVYPEMILIYVGYVVPHDTLVNGMFCFWICLLSPLSIVTSGGDNLFFLYFGHFYAWYLLFKLHCYAVICTKVSEIQEYSILAVGCTAHVTVVRVTNYKNGVPRIANVTSYFKKKSRCPHRNLEKSRRPLRPSKYYRFLPLR